jgi:AbiV family abortive infection protein
MDLRAVRAAERPELADFAVAAARNAQNLLDDAELLSASGRSGRAYSLAVLAVEESGEGMNLASLACLPDSFRAQAPLRRLLEWHQVKLAGGLLLTALPFGNVGTTIAAMPAGELAQALRSLAPADESDRLRLRGLYVEMDRDGRISEPPEVTGRDVAAQLQAVQKFRERRAI